MFAGLTVAFNTEIALCYHYVLLSCYFVRDLFFIACREQMEVQLYVIFCACYCPVDFCVLISHILLCTRNAILF